MAAKKQKVKFMVGSDFEFRLSVDNKSGTDRRRAEMAEFFKISKDLTCCFHTRTKIPARYQATTKQREHKER